MALWAFYLFFLWNWKTKTNKHICTHMLTHIYNQRFFGLFNSDHFSASWLFHLQPFFSFPLPLFISSLSLYVYIHTGINGFSVANCGCVFFCWLVLCFSNQSSEILHGTCLFFQAQGHHLYCVWMCVNVFVCVTQFLLSHGPKTCPQIQKILRIYSSVSNYISF